MSDHPRPSSLEPNEQGATGSMTRSHTLDSLERLGVFRLCKEELEKYTDFNKEVKDKTETTVRQVMEMRKISPASSDSSGVNSNLLTLPGTKEGISPGRKRILLKTLPLHKMYFIQNIEVWGIPRIESYRCDSLELFSRCQTFVLNMRYMPISVLI